MRKLPGVVVAVLSTLLLAACSVLPSGPPAIQDDALQKMNARMGQIVEALNDQDPAALKAMFSPHALKQVSEIDEGLDHLLSFFPNGVDTWEIDKFQEEGRNTSGKKTELLLAYYRLSADGSDYWFFFADFTVNDVTNSDNVGIYAMGAESRTENELSDAEELFLTWAASIRYDESDPNGYPGVYVGE
jgi:hypothetical protein